MKITKIHVIGVFVFLLFYTFCGTAFSDQNIKVKDNDIQSSKSNAGTLIYPIQFYRKYISGVDGNRCQMEPSCSKYCMEAIKKHGAFLGWIMCCDRLVRCGRDEKKVSAPIWINGERRIYDPIGQNDSWW